MRKAAFLTLLFVAGIAISRAGGPEDFRPETLVAIERGAMDRWGNGDPRGYLEIYAPDVTYFDEGTGRRVDGLKSMEEYLLPRAGKIKIDHYEIVGAKVQRNGDMAVLSFIMVTYGKEPGPGFSMNSTEVYERIDGKWKIVHSHWSNTKPEPKK